MKIIARIEKVGSEQFLFDGRVFESFLLARREMVERARRRRQEPREADRRTERDLPVSFDETCG